ncbi:protease Do [Coraliomargarita sinensis]|uniref:Protease Do n=1 Tax=Coraliomargarita sinensis TaxID=2174842 RepID=A0A317ZLV6_9BACT|nr:Do family serine endopeptidase [Coraliomargarita sinensis]PXA05213.1 protease Do [Coraliomargarita sinensis]
MKIRVILTLLALSAFQILFGNANPELRVNIDDSQIRPSQDGPVVTYAEVLKRATPSVVAVYTSRIVTERSGGRQPVPEIFRQFGFPVPDNAPGGEAPRERREQIGVGSGVIISTDGYIITNHHVVQGMRGREADEIRVQLSDGSEYEAELIGSDEKTDVAVLKIEAEDELPAITLADSDKLRVGDVVFAIGNPLDVGLTATQGIVSATGRNSYGILGPGAYEDFIQTDAAINLGNSGGALIDAWGRLIGINTAIVSRSGGSIGIGFAIPLNMALNVAQNLINSGEVPRGMLGLFPANLDRDMADAFGLETTQGALVNQVQPDSPAERAGIEHGDIIMKIDDIEIVSAPQLRLEVSQMLPGSKVMVTLIRQGKTMKLPVTLGSLNGMAYNSGEDSNYIRGVLFEAIDDEMRENYAIPDEIEGVFVADVEGDSPFAGKLEQRMVILEINGETVEQPGDIEGLLEEGMNRLYIWGAGQKRFIVLKL